MPAIRPPLLPFMLGIALFAPACSVPTAAEECFVDAHCPDGVACVEGQCAMPGTADGGSEDTHDISGKLDVGNGIGNARTCEAVSFIATNAGCEFWAVDLPNIWEPSSPYSLNVASDQQFAVVVANIADDVNAHVSVFVGTEATALEEATVGPLGTYAFLLPSSLQLDPVANGGGTAFRVESDVPITAYQFQPLDNVTPVYSNDATSLLPAHVLQTDYIAVTDFGREVNVYPSGWTETAVPAGAFVTVVATEDETRVDLFPTEVLVDGGWQGIRLNRGNTFTIISDPSNVAVIDGSLSGTRVIADKPVAVFSGNIAAGVPAGATECCLDHVEHQLLPTVAWGTRYVAAPPPDPDVITSNDPVVVRLVGAYDDTPLVYPAGKPAGAPDTIHAHQDIELSTTEPIIVESSDEAKPFSLTQYLYNSGEANPGGEMGDPAMIVVPAVEQLMDRYVFLAPYGYRTNVVTIVAPAGAEVTLDDGPVGSFATIGDSGGVTWTYARVEIEAGAHVVSADMPVGVTIVGYDRQVSYAYAGGSAVDVIHDAPPAP